MRNLANFWHKGQLTGTLGSYVLPRCEASSGCACRFERLMATRAQLTGAAADDQHDYQAQVRRAVGAAHHVQSTRCAQAGALRSEG
jgi:hypothetical protein